MTVAVAVSPVNSLVLHSACIGGVNAPRFNDFFAQTREDLDPDEGLSSFTTVRQNIEIPPFPRAVNTELGMLPAYSPFLNIEEQTIGSLKAENSRNCFKPFFSVCIRVGGEKNDETCRTHAKKYLHSICLEIHADYVTFLFEK